MNTIRGRGGRAAAVAAAVAAALSACGGPSRPTVTQESVEPAAAAPAPPLPREAGTARAFAARSPSDLPGGPAAAGEPGDLVLRNDKLVAVIRAANHRGRIAATGGNLVDLAPAGGQDALGEVALFVDPDARALPVFTEVAVAQDGREGGLAIVRAAGHDPRDEQVAVDVDYVLDSGDDRLRVMTTITHRGRSHYRDYVVGHWLSWGTLVPFVPGPGDALEGRRTRSAWVGADAPDGALALAGLSGLLEATHGRDFSQVVEHRAYLAPGAVVAWETSLFVARTGGVAAAAALLADSRQAVTGQLQGRLTERRRGRPVADGWILAAAPDGTLATRARAGASGEFVLDLEPGRYRLVAVAPGRRPAEPVPVEVAADRVGTVDLVVDPPGRLRLTVTDERGAPLPARAALVGAPGTPTPVLGPPSSLPVAGPFVYAPAGTFAGRILPGTYVITVGAGPRYGQATRTVTIEPGRTAEVTAALPRQMEAASWTAVDPHVHTVHGPTSGVTGQARLDACRVEGVDAVVASDERGGEPWPAPPAGPDPAALVALRGVELQAADARLGALPLAALPTLPLRLPETAATALPFLRGLPGRPLVAVFRPRGRALGYFEAFAFDPAAPALPRGGFTLDFDLLEVLAPGLGPDTDRAMADYLALAARGRPLIPLAGSGSDDLVADICGAPRTWIRAPVRDAATLEAGLRRAPVVVSGGPLLELAVSVRPSFTTAAVRVTAPAWARPTTLELLTDRPDPERVVLEAGAGPLDLTREFVLPAGARFAAARVDGPRRPNPLYPAGVRPLALTAAVALTEAGPAGTPAPSGP